jgi:hypothetical protein
VLQISRAQARLVRAVLRRCLFDGCGRNDWPLLRVRADGRQLILESARGPRAIRFQWPATEGGGAVAFRATALAAFEGRTPDAVTLETIGTGRSVARWQEAGVPQEQLLETVPPDSLPELPEMPSSLVAMPESFCTALAEAALSTASQGTRFALEQVQMGGPDGALIATDGKQLLIQRGFPLPWTERLLLPRLRLTGLPGVGEHEPARLGRTRTHVILELGAWTFFLQIAESARYPDVEGVLPRPARISSRCQLAAEDVARLIEVLPKLPGDDQDQKPVTVDLGEALAVRGRDSQSSPAAEVPLPDSPCSGQPVRFATPRELLLRALRLGFTQVEISRPDAPIIVRDATRVFGWMPLDASAVVPAEAAHIRLARPEATAVVLANPESSSPHSELRSPTMPSASSNGHSPDERQPEANSRSAGIDELLSEAESLRQHLSEAAARATRLVAALKHHRRQARAVEAAVSSLRDLRLGSR